MNKKVYRCWLRSSLMYIVISICLDLLIILYLRNQYASHQRLEPLLVYYGGLHRGFNVNEFTVWILQALPMMLCQMQLFLEDNRIRRTMMIRYRGYRQTVRPLFICVFLVSSLMVLSKFIVGSIAFSSFPYWQSFESRHQVICSVTISFFRFESIGFVILSMYSSNTHFTQAGVLVTFLFEVMIYFTGLLLPEKSVFQPVYIVGTDFQKNCCLTALALNVFVLALSMIMLKKRYRDGNMVL